MMRWNVCNHIYQDAKCGFECREEEKTTVVASIARQIASIAGAFRHRISLVSIKKSKAFAH